MARERPLKGYKMVGFILTYDDIKKLQAISERYDGNQSMTMRNLIRQKFTQEQG